MTCDCLLSLQESILMYLGQKVQLVLDFVFPQGWLPSDVMVLKELCSKGWLQILRSNMKLKLVKDVNQCCLANGSGELWHAP